MGAIEELYQRDLSDKDFKKTALNALMQITQKYNNNYPVYINRLFKMYGRRGIISALITLDVAMMSDNFQLGDNFYPFLVYGAKKAFERNETQSDNLNDIANKLLRRRHK